MYFKRAQATALIRTAIARFPVTILAMEAGTGKSRLIDLLFADQSNQDLQHAVLVRLDERITSVDALARCFCEAMGHHLPDDGNYYAFILAAIKKLPEHAVIVVDDLQALPPEGQRETAKFIASLIDATVLDAAGRHRWLVASRDVNDWPHPVWRARGKCRVFSSRILGLSREEARSLEIGLELPPAHLAGWKVRDLMLCHAALRALRILPAEYLATRHWLPPIRTGDRSAAGVRSLLMILNPELVQALFACSLAYDLSSEIMSDSIPNIGAVIEALGALDLAFVDLASGRICIDAVVRDYLHDYLAKASEETIRVAVRLACDLHCEGANIKRGFAIIVERKLWDLGIEILRDYGLDFLDRDTSYALISSLVHDIPETNDLGEIPEVQGIKGMLAARASLSDTSETWLLCVIQNKNVAEYFRLNIFYRYCAELARRGRPDAIDHLKQLLDYLYADSDNTQPLQALSHSLLAAIQSGRSAEAALSQIDRAMTILAHVDDVYAQARVRYDCAYALKNLQEFERSVALFTQAATIAVEHRFLNMASGIMANLQEIAYYTEHNTPLAMHYLKYMQRYAQKNHDRRAEMHAWLGLYWLAIDSGSQSEIESTYSHIDRYRMSDDFMQGQIQRTVVPATAMLRATGGDFAQAIVLIESYAKNSDDPEFRVYRWAELCLYYAAEYLKSRDVAIKRKYIIALREVRATIRLMNGVVHQEGDIALRVLLSLALMDRKAIAARFLPYFDQLLERDQRAPYLQRMLKSIITWQDDITSVHAFMDGVKGLEQVHMGGMARIILALPVSTGINRTQFHRDKTNPPGPLVYDPLCALLS